jgi:hypothetical protein
MGEEVNLTTMEVRHKERGATWREIDVFSDA